MESRTDDGTESPHDISNNVIMSNATGKPATPPQEAGAAVPTATTPPSTGPSAYRQNQVSTTTLYGVRIVSLVIDDRERLCLAQISNTLLKDYSYNEIHNRRVALGITCVQCTPVQLEILRRAGAMPISSRRCGMITKREAERLVKSFLEDTAPPKLPENFAFDVKHECGWGCRGSFVPSRYNSSRAKCIKCCYCNMFFSPNKFIFHYHRMPESKYSHPDAANFNSWRRHLKLNSQSSSDELVHAWEDVKAMFNGGNRKRVLSGSCSYSRPTPPSHQPKRPKLEGDRVSVPSQAPPNTITTVAPPAPQPPYHHYPVFPIPNKLYSPLKGRPAHPAFPLPFPYDKPPILADNEPMSLKQAHSPNSAWGTAPETMYPPYEMIWAKHLGLSSTESNYATSYQNPKLSPKQLSPYKLSPPPRQAHDVADQTDVSRARRERSTPDPDSADHAMLSHRHEHFSAFRPVAGKVRDPCDLETQREATNAAKLAPSQSDYSFDCARVADDDNDDDGNGSDCESVDVDTVDEPEQNNNMNRCKSESDDFETQQQQLQQPEKEDNKLDSSSEAEERAVLMDSDDAVLPSQDSRGTGDASADEQTGSGSCSSSAGVPDDADSSLDKVNNDSGISDEIEEDQDEHRRHDHLAELSKDELQKELATQLQTRRRLEEDCRAIKDTFQEQVKREQQYREDTAKQLQIVRETLCHELDQERKARFSLQQKLKEAHDALHNFSCKLLAARDCKDCTSFSEPAIIPR